jgi:hypothetical protein
VSTSSANVDSWSDAPDASSLGTPDTGAGAGAVYPPLLFLPLSGTEVVPHPATSTTAPTASAAAQLPYRPRIAMHPNVRPEAPLPEFGAVADESQ